MTPRSTARDAAHDSRPVPESQLFVYQTARGLLRTTRGKTPAEAWERVRGRHRPTVMFALDGRAFTCSIIDGVAQRFADYDIPTARARSRYFDACLVEIPIDREELARLTRGAVVAQALLRACHERGLYDLSASALTRLGRAFAALTGSEVALARILSSYEEWPGPDSGEGADVCAVLLRLGATLIEDGRYLFEDGLTPQGQALVERVRKAGML